MPVRSVPGATAANTIDHRASGGAVESEHPRTYRTEYRIG